ncbi:MAG: Ig-like domain-containing protein [Verrucomicrobiota bacterium JB023]|nr:Ig-like domain-containing protein [Verrucomicrobiota bacterium JB023]
MNPDNRLPLLTSLFIAVASANQIAADEVILAGWHDFSSAHQAHRYQNSAKEPDDAYPAVGGTLWGGNGSRNANQGSNDGTYGGTFAHGSSSLDGAMSVRTDSAGITFTITNQGVRAIGLHRILFDFASINGNSPANLQLVYQQGDLDDNGGTIVWSAQGIHNGIGAAADYEDVEIPLTALSDRSLARGETARFLLTGDAASNPTQALFLDNVAITGVVNELAVLTYNIHGGYGPSNEGNPNDNLTAFRDNFMQGQDVLGLQEVGQGSTAADEYQAAQDVFSAEYPYSFQTIYEATDRSWFQSPLESSLAIFSRYPFVSTHSQLIQIDPGGDEWSRYAQHVVIEVAGEAINIFNFHNTYNFFDNDYEWEKAGLAKFKDYVYERLGISDWSEADASNVIMLGDFNLRNGSNFLDVTEVLAPPVIVSNSLDHIASVEDYSSSGSYATVAADLSDHPSVWASYDFTPPSALPMTWAASPAESALCEVSMQADFVSDSNNVEYYFTNKTVADGSHDSGWQRDRSYTDTGLEPETTYEYTVKVRDLSPNLNEGTESAIASVTTAPLVAQTLPYTEGFETGMGAWKQSADDDWNWSLQSGGTPTGNTGPSGASEGAHYLYVENHGSGAQYKTSSIEALFNLADTWQPILAFDYHMHGPYIDFLAVDIHDGTTWSEAVWLREGQQQASSEAPWLRATVDLTPFAGLETVTVRFRSKQEQWHAADTAIDQLTVTDTNQAPQAEEQSLIINGETSLTLAGSDPDDDALTFSLESMPAHGSLTGTPPQLTYSPENGYTGPDEFSFKVNDGRLDSDEVKVTLFVGNVLVSYAHPGGATTPSYQLDILDSTASLGGVLSGGAIASTVDQLSAAEGTGLPADIDTDDFSSYFSYLVTPNEVTIGYESLFVDAFAKADSRLYQVSYLVDGSEEVFLSPAPVPAGTPDEEGNFDSYPIPDLVTDAEVEFRIYWQGGPASTSQARVYVDDCVLTGQVVSPLERWRLSHFGTSPSAETAADTGNPDGDSMDNYSEFILGTDPLRADSPLSLLSSNNGNMTVAYSRRKDAEARVYAEWSPDLQSPWVTDGLLANLSSEEGEFEHWTVTVPVDASSPRKFVRLVVEMEE